MFTYHKLIVAGGRDFDDYDLLSRQLDKIRQSVWSNFLADDLEVVSGTARGADKLGERWAERSHVKIKRFPADWDRYGKRAGYLRNEKMAKYADTLLAAWDGESKGTGHMINLAKDNGLGVLIIRY
jgi:hypothetical protein